MSKVKYTGLRLSEVEKATFTRNCTWMRSDPSAVLYNLVAAFNESCAKCRGNSAMSIAFPQVVGSIPTVGSSPEPHKKPNIKGNSANKHGAAGKLASFWLTAIKGQ